MAVEIDADMNGWPQREMFKREIEAYRDKTGMHYDELAGLLNVTPDTLKSYVYRKSAPRPGIAFLLRASEIFGISITELIDDPGKGTANSRESYLSLIEKRERMIKQLLGIVWDGDPDSLDGKESETDYKEAYFELALKYSELKIKYQRLLEKHAALVDKAR